jgi:hypothetical protein
MQTIEIIVTKNGKVKVEAFGFQGSSCEEATRFIEEKLGTASSSDKKPEFYSVNDIGLPCQFCG